jgi:hypothetical protein
MSKHHRSKATPRHLPARGKPLTSSASRDTTMGHMPKKNRSSRAVAHQQATTASIARKLHPLELLLLLMKIAQAVRDLGMAQLTNGLTSQ